MNNLGKEGERLAEKYLIKSGYKIIKKNFNTKFGEIDIIAKDSDTICFIEVKFRNNSSIENSGIYSVNDSKVKKMIKTAKYYIKVNRIIDPCRFDLVLVKKNEKKIQIELINNIIYTDNYY